MKTNINLLLVLVSLTCCDKNKNSYDASGTFEANETIIAAEATGTIKQLDIEEGQTLIAGEKIGYIDSTQLYLRKKQFEAQIRTTLSQRPNISKQLASLQAQLKSAQREQARIGNLVKADAATPKQLDDANAQVDVIKRQIEAQQSSLGISTNSLVEQTNPLQIQVEQVEDQLDKCKLINPIEGTVLIKYAQQFEIAVSGKPLYKIANLSSLILRAYVTGNQFSSLKINQHVKVLVDKGDNQYKEYSGTIAWISSKAEFTPKTIQTKEERANLVYAIKIDVKNDGYLKIGMYADVKI